MKKKKTLIIVTLLFLVFSFFSYQCYFLLQEEIKNKEVFLQNKNKKKNAINIMYKKKNKTTYNKEKNIELKKSYYTSNIIIPGNPLSSKNLTHILEELETKENNKLEEKISKSQDKNQVYRIDEDLEILYMNKKIISFYKKTQGYFNQKTIYSYNPYSYNIYTGQRITYASFSKNTRKLKEKIRREAIKKINEKYTKSFSILKLNQEIEKERFYLDKDGMTLYLKRCGVLDCFYGDIFINIPYKRIEDVVKEKYI